MCLGCVIEEITGFDLQTDEGHDALAAMKARGERIPWPAVTDEMKEAAALIGALYANPAGSTGGPLHITTDDNNVEDGNLEFCRKDIETWAGWDCTPEQEDRVKVISGWILDLLWPMDTKARAVTIELGHGNLSEFNGRVYRPSTEFPIREEVRDAEGNYLGTQWGFRSRTVGSQLGDVA